MFNKFSESINSMLCNLSKLLKSNFFKNVALTSGGIGVGVVANFALQPIITRIYLPETIGMLALIISMSGVINVISSLGFEKAILVSDNKQEATDLASLSVIILILISLILFILPFLGLEELIEDTKYEPIKKVYWIMPIIIFFKGVNQIIQLLLMKLNRYKSSSISETVKTIVPGILKIILGGFFGSNVLFLILSALIGSIINTVYLLSSILKIIRNEIVFSLIRCKKVFIKYIDYLKYFNWINLLNSFSQQVVFLLLISFYSTEVLGYFSLAYSVILLPVGLISNALFKVYLPNISKKISKKQKITKDFRKVTYLLAIIGFAGFSLLYLIAPWLFEKVFGFEWRMSGIYSQYLIPWIFMLFINKPANSVIQYFQRFKWLLVYNIVILMLRIFSVFSGYYFFDSVISSLFLFSLVGFFGNLYFISYSYNVTLRYDKKI